MLASTIEFLRPIPSVALVPIAVLLFGARCRPTLLLVVYAAFWPILLQVIHGVARRRSGRARHRPVVPLRAVDADSPSCFWPTGCRTS